MFCIKDEKGKIFTLINKFTGHLLFSTKGDLDTYTDIMEFPLNSIIEEITEIENLKNDGYWLFVPPGTVRWIKLKLSLVKSNKV